MAELVCKPIPWLTAEILRDLLSYDPITGLFRWRHAAGRYGRIPAGTIAGSVSKAHGYRLIGLGGNGKTVKANILAWLYMTGEWPSRQVDHRNGCESDDSWENLRLATQSQNKANSGIYRNNTSGVPGVFYDSTARGKKWRAVISVNKRVIRLGRYATKEEAAEVRKRAVTEHFGEFARKETA